LRKIHTELKARDKATKASWEPHLGGGRAGHAWPGFVKNWTMGMRDHYKLGLGVGLFCFAFFARASLHNACYVKFFAAYEVAKNRGRGAARAKSDNKFVIRQRETQSSCQHDAGVRFAPRFARRPVF